MAILFEVSLFQLSFATPKSSKQLHSGFGEKKMFKNVYMSTTIQMSINHITSLSNQFEFDYIIAMIVQKPS